MKETKKVDVVAMATHNANAEDEEVLRWATPECLLDGQQVDTIFLEVAFS